MYPYIGNTPLAQITTELLEIEVINRIVNRNALKLARKVSIAIKMILEFARKKKLITINPAYDITQPKPINGHFPAITDSSSLSSLLKHIWNDNDPRITFVTRCAVKLSIFIFLRPGQIRMLKWEEYDPERRVLTIQPSKQSSSRPKSTLVIPLADQAVELFDELYKITGHTKYIFYSNRSSNKYLSENAVNESLKRLGYNGKQTAHGFRATARTILEEQLNFDPSWIERQLAHKVKDANGESYNRRTMLQAWANHIMHLLVFYPKSSKIYSL